jgi:hypothetical protein
VLNPSGFVCRNEIRDHIRGKEGSENKEIGGEIRVKERGGNNNK